LAEYLAAGRDDLPKSYFHLGLEYMETSLFLVFSHGINLSLKQLKRILKAKVLGRRRNVSDLKEVVQALKKELRGSGNNMGYRQMTPGSVCYKELYGGCRLGRIGTCRGEMLLLTSAKWLLR